MFVECLSYRTFCDITENRTRLVVSRAWTDRQTRPAPGECASFHCLQRDLPDACYDPHDLQVGDVDHCSKHALMLFHYQSLDRDGRFNQHPLLPFRTMGIFVISADAPLFTQPYK